MNLTDAIRSLASVDLDLAEHPRARAEVARVVAFLRAQRAHRKAARPMAMPRAPKTATPRRAS